MPTTTRLFRWGPQYFLGVNEIDRQHEALTVALNQLYETVQEGVPRGQVSDRLRILCDSVRQHCQDEERLMEESEYPRLPYHRSEHEFIIDRVSEIQREFDSGEADLDDSALRYLKNWLRDHMLISDKRMGEFLVTHRR